MSFKQTFFSQKLPFQEAIDYFRQKEPLRLGTEEKPDTYKGMRGEIHDRAFMVSRLAQDDVLLDLYKAVDKAISQSTSLSEFQKDFIAAIENKWEPKQNRGWRARIIYETNIRTAYAAGRYQQMTDMLDTHPYWMYRHGGSAKPREAHKALDGKVFRADDPFWDKHYPPNGWGCSCYVVALTEGDMKRRGLKLTRGSEIPETVFNPDAKEDEPIVSTDWKHAPGRVATQYPNRQGAGLPTPSGYRDNPFRQIAGVPNSVPPEAIPERELKGGLLSYNASVPDAERRQYAIDFVREKALEGKPKKMFVAKYGKCEVPFVISAEGLGGHIADHLYRLPYFGCLPDVLAPQEMWINFVQKEGSNGKGANIAMRYTLITSLKVKDKTKFLVVVLQKNDLGEYEVWTVIPKKTVKDLKNDRKGFLVTKHTD
jgi:SPP1 gp7 family putative phage head morphogenesis protein